MTFDIGGDGLRFAVWRLGLAFVIEVVGPQTLESHMRAPGVVPVLEFAAQRRQVVKALDEGDASEPFVLERLDDAFCHSNGLALSHSPNTLGYYRRNQRTEQHSRLALEQSRGSCSKSLLQTAYRLSGGWNGVVIHLLL